MAKTITERKLDPNDFFYDEEFAIEHAAKNDPDQKVIEDFISKGKALTSFEKGVIPSFEEIPEYYMEGGVTPKFTQEGGYSPEYIEQEKAKVESNWASHGARHGFDPTQTTQFVIPGDSSYSRTGNQETIYKGGFFDNPNAKSDFFEKLLIEHNIKAPEDFGPLAHLITNEKLPSIGNPELIGNIYEMYEDYIQNIEPMFEGKLTGDFNWKTGGDMEDWIKSYKERIGL